MPEINAVGGTNAYLGISGTGGAPQNGTTQSGGSIPPVNGGTDFSQAALPPPTLPSPSTMVGPLSLETLVQAIGMEQRDTATKTGLESIKTKAQERDNVNALKMEEIQKNLDAMRSKGVADGFLKAFQVIGVALSAIAAVATIIVGAMTANPLLIAAGAIMAVMAVNSVVSAATDGKVSIAAGVAALAESCGVSEETAKWIGMAVEVGITLVGCALSLGAGFAAAGAKAVSTAGKAAEALSLASKATTIASGLNTVGMGVSQGVGAYYEYKGNMSVAEQKELAAILERIQEAIDLEHDYMESIMERCNEMMGDVKEIVQDSIAAQTAILTGSTPSMA